MKTTPRLAATAAILLLTTAHSQAMERYNDGCQICHGEFTGSTSPKGTVFPFNSKHEMHRHAQHMNTECKLCHRSDDQNNPFIGSSDGTDNNLGLGCSGCHVGEGLRAHHVNAGQTSCATPSTSCHGGAPNPTLDENVAPPYYGSADTRVENPCNTALVSKANENWSVGDFLGLDNDGDLLYDLADFACGTYRIVNLTPQGGSYVVTWETAGGRTDVIQATSDLSTGFTNISPPFVIQGIGTVTTNFIIPTDTDNSRFFRIMYAP